MSITWDLQQLFSGQRVLITGSVVDRNGAAVNITGWQFALYAVNEEDEDDTYSLTNSAFTITSAADGEFQCVVPRADTSDFVNENWKVEIWRVDSGADDVIADGVIHFVKSARPGA